MLARPFAPFRMRPLKLPTARRVPASDIILGLSEPELPRVKASRSPIKPQSRLKQTTLRVLKGPSQPGSESK